MVLPWVFRFFKSLRSQCDPKILLRHEVKMSMMTLDHWHVAVPRRSHSRGSFYVILGDAERGPKIGTEKLMF